MNKKKRNIIIVSILFVTIVLVIIGIFCFGNDGTTNILLINDKKDNGSKEEINTDNEEDNADNNYMNELDNDNINTNNNLDSSEDYDEEDVIEYFENMENEVKNSSSFKEKFKEYFTTIVDFIFYDKKIKGHTFRELSGTAKAKVVGIALKIDNKIEEYVPNYKETISSTSGKIYSNIKEKLVALYMDIATDICKNNEEGCNTVKDIFADIKSTCKIGWDFIKNLIGSGTSKIKEWYEIYSGKY